LGADAGPGDLVVFYFAGHGSRRLDTNSSKNHLDETIVPIDAWQGTEDIRDKELAVLFNRIVFEKQARLTAIFDSCHSGTMARGATDSVQRTLPYDDRDVAKETGATTELDLEQIPQKGNAIIVAAADPTESAVEAQYPDDGEFHGAFTRALVRVLRSNTETLSAEDTIAEVSSILHADPVPFQQPSVEGRLKESLFGEAIAPHPLHVHIAKIEGTRLTLDLGSAVGFDVGTQFRALEGTREPKTVLEVSKINGPMSALAQVQSGAADIAVGETFEMSKMVYPQAARLTVFLPKAAGSPDAASVAQTKVLFPRLTWVQDPTETQIKYFVVQGAAGWVAIDQNNHAIAPGGRAQGPAFLMLGPPPSLIARIQQSEPFKRSAFLFTENLGDANYILTMRLRADGTREYAFVSPEVLANHPANTYLRSTEEDAVETGLNDGLAPEVVCRSDSSMPVMTAWLHGSGASEPADDELAPALDRRMVRIGRLRLWQQSPALAPGSAGWPYRLAFAKSGSADPMPAGPLQVDEAYDVQLLKAPGSSGAMLPKYVYLFGFDCAANPQLFYPTAASEGSGRFPEPDRYGAYPASLKLASEVVGTPLGADTFFLVASKEKIADPNVLVDDGVIVRTARGGDPFEQLIVAMGDATTRGPDTVPKEWLVQHVLIPSKP
jgi:hypothetical protein